MKKKDQELEKLVKLTKLMKLENVRVAPKGPPKGANKWRSQDPKFVPKEEKPSDLVEAGGMQVDASRREEYENWRKDKVEEADFRRAQAERKAQASRERRKSSPEPDA
jgi:hypothetical protein